VVLEVTPNLEWSVTFDMSWEEVCLKLDLKFSNKLASNLGDLAVT
jgi:hypothetical protein